MPSWKWSNLSLRKEKIDLREELATLDTGHKVGLLQQFLPHYFTSFPHSPYCHCFFKVKMGKAKETRGEQCVVNWYSCNLMLMPWWSKCLLLTCPFQVHFVGSTIILTIRFTDFSSLGELPPPGDCENLKFWTCHNLPYCRLSLLE